MHATDTGIHLRYDAAQAHGVCALESSSLSYINMIVVCPSVTGGQWKQT